MDSAVAHYHADLNAVPGWLSDLDFRLIDWLLSDQEANGKSGDILEIGAYRGQSAILLGLHRRPTETFTVCDIFGEISGSPDTYAGLDLAAFLANYRRYVDSPPTILAKSSVTIRPDVSKGSCRFIHVDGAHQYDVVKEDVITAVQSCSETGIIVFDDYRSAHTPGVAAAVWAAIARQIVFPVCLSENKLYASVEPLDELVARLHAWASRQSDVQAELQDLMGRQIMRAWMPPDSAARVIASIVTTRLGWLLHGRDIQSRGQILGRQPIKWGLRARHLESFS